MHAEFTEWTTKNVESIVFNAPGLEPDMFEALEQIPNAYHIANAGMLLPKRLQKPTHTPQF
jgi:hypothetical protein